VSEENNPKVIYLGPFCQEQGLLDGREWCQDDVWDACECGHESVRYNLGADFDRVTAERDAALGREAALREKLSTANGCLNEWRRSTLGRTLLENAALQQRLTAADEREDALGSLVPEAELALKALNVAVSVYDVELADSARRGLRLIISALKPAECCTVSAEDRALLEAGDYTPEELFGIGGKPSCPKCAP